MKKNTLLVILFVGLVFFLFLPLISQAGIVPCGGTGQPICTLCHLVIGIHDLIDYGFKIVVFVALVAIVISGIMYVVSAGNEQMMQTAKSFIKTTLAGFAIVLGAWVIVNTTIWLIGAKGSSDTGGVLGIGVVSWNKFDCKTPTP